MKLLVSVGLVFLALVSACRAQNASTGDELNAKIKSLTDDELIDCLKEKPTYCPLVGLYLYRPSIMLELAARHHPDVLIVAYHKAVPEDRSMLLETLGEIDDPRVLAYMRSIAFENLPLGPDTEGDLLSLDYLAQRCDRRALARLNRRINFDKNIPRRCTYEWANALKAFGRCQYFAAAPNLVRCLNDPCINFVLGPAAKSLFELFPGCTQPLQSHSTEDPEHCYKRLIQKRADTKPGASIPH